MIRMGRVFAAITAVSLIGCLPASAFQKRGRKSEAKPQSEVASKTPFPTILESSPEVKQALKARDFDGAKKLIGKEGAFQGTVAKVFTPDGNSVNILNFDKNFRNALVAAIKAEDYARFPDLQTLVDKRVLVKGKFVDYRGVPELSVTNAGAIKIIK